MIIWDNINQPAYFLILGLFAETVEKLFQKNFSLSFHKTMYDKDWLYLGNLCFEILLGNELKNQC
jgi:hypothetical protein